VTPQELLLAVADHFEAHPDTWIQEQAVRDYPDGRICFCVDGALYFLSGPRTQQPNTKLYQAAYKRLADALNQTWIHGWNDKPGRTVAEVIAKLREAAA
jgi:hypothetical protein